MHWSNLLSVALAAHIAPGHSATGKRDENTSTAPVILSLIPPIEPWTGFFEFKGVHESRSLKTRSVESGAVCAEQPSGVLQDTWQLEQAVCDRKNADHNTFMVDCVEKQATDRKTTLLPGVCPEDFTCSEFHGLNGLDQLSFDVKCLNRTSARQWTITQETSTEEGVCSPFYRNFVKGSKTVNISLLVNVLDSDMLNRIAPKSIYFRIGNKSKIGNEQANDSVVDSGIITLPNGSEVQACVEPMLGQILVAIVNIFGLTVLT